MKAFLFCVLFGIGVTTAAASNRCPFPDVQSIEVPVYPERADSPRFSYSFQFHHGGSPRDPVVIFLPGGPGEPSITRDPSHFPALPADLNVIYTDQRGTGATRSHRPFPTTSTRPGISPKMSSR